MKTIDKVKELLTDHPFLRDNRTKLIAQMLVREGMTSEEAFIVANNFTKAASIVRASCRLQQTNPELRGKNYQSRVNKAEQERVKELLGYGKLPHDKDKPLDYEGYTAGKIVDDGKGGFRVQFKRK